MVDKIPNNQSKNINIPYRISETQPLNSTGVSLFETFKFKPIILDSKPKKQTEAQMLYESWSNVVPNVSEDFFNEITAMSKRLKCEPEDLAALIYQESKFNPKADGGKYKGLIQMNNYSLKKSIEYSQNHSKKSEVLTDISMQDYMNLPADKQLNYAESYINLMKDECGLKDKKLSGGKLWGLIKSPKLTKQNNVNFFQKLEQHLNSIKDIPLKYEIPLYIKRID